MKFHATKHPSHLAAAVGTANHALTRREILARHRVIGKKVAHIKTTRVERLNAHYTKQALYKLLLIACGFAVAAMLARLANNAVYFITGVDYHILDGLFLQ